MNGGGLLVGERIKAYALAGSAILTVHNPHTGGRFTFRIRVSEPSPKYPNPVHFVDVLSGPNNEADYTYIGFVGERGRFIPSRKVSIDAPSVKAFSWFWTHVADPSPVEVFHEGRCGKCGRTLTTPESIETGLGPVCSARLS